MQHISLTACIARQEVGYVQAPVFGFSLGLRNIILLCSFCYRFFALCRYLGVISCVCELRLTGGSSSRRHPKECTEIGRLFYFIKKSRRFISRVLSLYIYKKKKKFDGCLFHFILLFHLISIILHNLPSPGPTFFLPDTSKNLHWFPLFLHGM